jgi:hypothetical protein
VATVNQHPHWYLHLFERGLLLVSILCPKIVRFELSEPDLVQTWEFFNI